MALFIMIEEDVIWAHSYAVQANKIIPDHSPSSGYSFQLKDHCQEMWVNKCKTKLTNEALALGWKQGLRVCSATWQAAEGMASRQGEWLRMHSQIVCGLPCSSVHAEVC